MWAPVRGLPGIILKIMAPGQPITLIEGSHKKCVFLEHISAGTRARPDANLAKRVETLVARGELLGEFDVTVRPGGCGPPRHPVPVWSTRPSGGRIVTFKGPGWEADARGRRGRGRPGKGGVRDPEVLRVPWGPGHLLLIRKEHPPSPDSSFHVKL